MEWGILSALAAVLQPENLIACLLGCLVGTVVGVLPGIGPFVTMAMLLPLTFEAPTTAGMIMLAGIYYGAMYGGSTTSILVNVPGESASVVTCLDGYQMARKGRGGAALAVAAIGSFVAGTLGIIALQLFAPPLANAALLFGPPEFFAITLLGLTVLSTLTGRMPLKSQIMACFGIMLSTVGMDPLTGMDRLLLTRNRFCTGSGCSPSLWVSSAWPKFSPRLPRRLTENRSLKYAYGICIPPGKSSRSRSLRCSAGECWDFALA